MPGLLDDILILLAVTVLAVALFQRLRLPSSLGYLLVGLLVGPGVLGWIPDADDTRVLARATSRSCVQLLAPEMIAAG